MEAFYDYLGVVYSVPLEDFVLIDTGGGSTEIVLVEKRKMTARISIPYGAVVLGKMFGENHAEMKQFLRQKLRELPIFAAMQRITCCGTRRSTVRWAKHIVFTGQAAFGQYP